MLMASSQHSVKTLHAVQPGHPPVVPCHQSVFPSHPLQVPRHPPPTLRQRPPAVCILNRTTKLIGNRLTSIWSSGYNPHYVCAVSRSTSHHHRSTSHHQRSTSHHHSSTSDHQWFESSAKQPSFVKPHTCLLSWPQADAVSSIARHTLELMLCAQHEHRAFHMRYSDLGLAGPPTGSHLLAANPPAAAPSFTCPTGATTFTYFLPLDPASATQAQQACEACYGLGQCALYNGDTSGLAYGLAPANSNPGPTFGYQASGLGTNGRTWRHTMSFVPYGYWGRF